MDNEVLDELDGLRDFEDDQDESEVEIPTSRRTINRDVSDPTVEVLYTRYKEGDLDLEPSFQRKFVWDSKKSSRLIESALLDVPLPIIYLVEESDGSESVIDGQQRLTSFFNFIDGQYSLGHLQVLKELNGCRYSDLEARDKNKIRKCSIRTITIKEGTDGELKFEIFHRINSGSVALTDQELRNCLYHGPYNDLIRELASDTDFRSLLGDRVGSLSKRMRDVELVLRFSAFYHSTYLKYTTMRKFLDVDMERYRSISDRDASELGNAFKKSVSLTKSIWPGNAFRRFHRGSSPVERDGEWSKNLNTALFDIVMDGFTLYQKSQVQPHLDSIHEALLSLMSTDDDFIAAIEHSTGKQSAVKLRFSRWRHELEAILGKSQPEPRSFSSQLKVALFESSRTCARCGSEIRSLDDAAVDHIHQYWRGGLTVPENARLLHRYCNWSRPRSD